MPVPDYRRWCARARWCAARCSPEPVATITLDRPDVLNAQTPATWQALRHIGEQLDPDVRVVVVRGSGRAFSAGLDRRMFTGEPVDGEPGGLRGDAGSLLAEEADANDRARTRPGSPGCAILHA